ncbi:exported hypothetical protein [Mesorhizobium metallidurans STM 2683]|uniref:Uncharacterized protein n=1 Tax=Mesorhizobium metallidurans STM 2683 TaxID=1297569 RepID=M5EX86_9HYPH|nr:exported hypothetical protein [Mesorhizobium metallidurans STM 2683]
MSIFLSMPSAPSAQACQQSADVDVLPKKLHPKLGYGKKKSRFRELNLANA